MSKNELSKASWIAFLGLVIAIVFMFAVGVPVASELVPTNDEALEAGLAWGMFGGCILGGVVVGVLCGRAGLSRIRYLTWLAAPGALISIPMLASAFLAHDWWHGLGYAIALAPISGAAAKVGSLMVRRKGPVGPARLAT